MNQIKTNSHPEVLPDSNLFPNFASQEEADNYLNKHPALLKTFQKLPPSMQSSFRDFCTRKRGLPITYDSVFRRIFRPDINQNRLADLISSIIGKKVRIIDILPREGTQLVEKGSFVIMDALVQLDDGTYANIEMQKIGYQFPLSRADCYSSDIIMRQYVRLKNELGNRFDFMNMHKVYCIILMETSPKPFHEFPGIYLHHRRPVFDTGIYKNNDGLHEDIFICLDSFRSIIHTINKDSSMQDAWLTFLSTTDLKTIHSLISSFPEFEAIYQEIADFVKDPKELMNMLSEELYIMDRNSERLMVNDLREAVAAKDKELIAKDKELAAKDERIAFLEQQLAELGNSQKSS